MHDLSQYPVYPWVLADYASPELGSRRPVFSSGTSPGRSGALNRQRLATLRERYRRMAAPPPPVEAPKAT